MASHGSSQQGRSSWQGRLGLTLVGLLLAAGAVAYSTLYFGMIQGEEFSPDVFKRRRFFYYEIPLIGLQVIPIRHSDNTGNLEALLITKKLVAVKKGTKTRWDLAVAQRGEAVSNVGDARILCNYLDSIDDEDKEVWLNWTEEHMELSQVLWPIIADLARQELYIFIPDVFLLAEQDTTPEQLSDTVKEMLTKKYLDLAQDQQSMLQHELAIELYSHALSYSPEHVEALRGRARSLDSLGKKQQAETDRALADKIHGRS